MNTWKIALLEDLGYLKPSSDFDEEFTAVSGELEEGLKTSLAAGALATTMALSAPLPPSGKTHYDQQPSDKFCTEYPNYPDCPDRFRKPKINSESESNARRKILIEKYGWTEEELDAAKERYRKQCSTDDAKRRQYSIYDAMERPYSGERRPFLDKPTQRDLISQISHCFI